MNNLNLDWQTFGQTQIKNILSKQIGTNNLSHAYLFFGKSGLGKQTLAKEFACKILKTNNLQSHPDFIYLDGDNELNIEIVRDFLDKISLKPFFSSKKVAILNGAENLNLQSSNALLKTLEEAPLNTIIILVYSEKNIIPTIASRCQVFNFLPLNLAELQSFAISNTISINQDLLNLSAGSPAKLLELSQDKKFFNEEKEKILIWQTIKSGKNSEKYLILQTLSDKEPEDLKEYFSSWLDWEIRNFPQAKLLENLRLAFVGLKKNYNKKMILQNLIISDKQ